MVSTGDQEARMTMYLGGWKRESCVEEGCADACVAQAVRSCRISIPWTVVYSRAARVLETLKAYR